MCLEIKTVTYMRYQLQWVMCIFFTTFFVNPSGPGLGLRPWGHKFDARTYHVNKLNILAVC